MANILVVAAHPDDEILGCGGTMARHAAAGDRVHVVLMTRGLASRGAAEDAAFARHMAAARQANARLGVTEVHQFDFPDNAMDTVSRLSLAKAIEEVVTKVTPRIVYTHHAGDLNVDHKQVCEAVAVACRPQPGHCVDEILTFETPSSTDWGNGLPANAFMPNHFCEIGLHLEAKIEALHAYDHEMRPWPHARSYEAVRHLAHWRGASVGLAAAEAFMLLRRIRRQT